MKKALPPPRVFLFAVIFLFTHSLACADIVTGLVGWWRLDGGTSGSIANNITAGLTDSSGKGNHGVARNTNGTGMAWAPGRLDGAVSFDGVDDHITVGVDALDMLTSDFSISAWVKSTSVVTGNNNGIVYKKSTAYGYDPGYKLNMPNGSFQFRIGDGINYRQLDAGSGYNDGLWHHVVAVADRGNELRIYVAGVSIGSVAESNVGSLDSPYYFAIGALRINSDIYHKFSGSIDDVRIYNRALSAADVTELYNNGGPTTIRNATIRDAVIR